MDWCSESPSDGMLLAAAATVQQLTLPRCFKNHEQYSKALHDILCRAYAASLQAPPLARRYMPHGLLLIEEDLAQKPQNGPYSQQLVNTFSFIMHPKPARRQEWINPVHIYFGHNSNVRCIDGLMRRPAMDDYLAIR